MRRRPPTLVLVLLAFLLSTPALIAACARPSPRADRSDSGAFACGAARVDVPAAAHDDEARYAMPFGRERARRLVQRDGGDRHAFDFAMPVGAPVLAARSGRVVCATATTVALRHADGTLGLYRGLSSISVSLGEAVSARSPIGASGSDGGTPCLHFAVLRARGGAIESVPIRFDDRSPEGFVPVPGDYYAGSAAPDPLPTGRAR